MLRDLKLDRPSLQKHKWVEFIQVSLSLSKTQISVLSSPLKWFLHLFDFELLSYINESIFSHKLLLQDFKLCRFMCFFRVSWHATKTSETIKKNFNRFILWLNWWVRVNHPYIFSLVVFFDDYCFGYRAKHFKISLWSQSQLVPFAFTSKSSGLLIWTVSVNHTSPWLSCWVHSSLV